MERRRFLGLAALAGGALTTMQARGFLDTLKDGTASLRMPVLFIGHGNPMNAIQDNPFTQHLRALGQQLERPKAVLVVSAHWLTRGGSFVSVNPRPATIHDFGGFPEELHRVQYPAPGAPDQARETVANVRSIQVHEDHEMGLDHGAWSVLRHIFPAADVPVFQLSIDLDRPPAEHYALAQELRGLRDKGILILGSGNVVHNLGRVNWSAPDAPAYDWAVEFDRFVAKNVASGDHQVLVDYQQLGAVARLAHPTNDHYLPLLYTLGVRHPGEAAQDIHTGLDMGSISMRSFLLG